MINQLTRYGDIQVGVSLVLINTVNHTNYKGGMNMDNIKIVNDSGELQGELRGPGKDVWVKDGEEIPLKDAEDAAANGAGGKEDDEYSQPTDEDKAKSVFDGFELRTSVDDEHSHIVNIYGEGPYVGPGEDPTPVETWDGYTNEAIGAKSVRHSHRVKDGVALAYTKNGHTHKIVKPKAQDAIKE